MKKIFALASSLTAIVFGWAAPALAQKPSDYFDVGGSLTSSGLPQTPVVDYVLNIVAVVLSLVGLVALILIIYAGFLILTSAGNEDRVQQGRTILLWSVVGVVIIFSALGITLFLNRIVTQ